MPASSQMAEGLRDTSSVAGLVEAADSPVKAADHMSTADRAADARKCHTLFKGFAVCVFWFSAAHAARSADRCRAPSKSRPSGHVAYHPVVSPRVGTP